MARVEAEHLGEEEHVRGGRHEVKEDDRRVEVGLVQPVGDVRTIDRADKVALQTMSREMATYLDSTAWTVFHKKEGERGRSGSWRTGRDQDVKRWNDQVCLLDRRLGLDVSTEASSRSVGHAQVALICCGGASPVAALTSAHFGRVLPHFSTALASTLSVFAASLSVTPSSAASMAPRSACPPAVAPSG